MAKITSIDGLYVWLAAEEKRLGERWSTSESSIEKCSLSGSILTIRKLKGLI